MSVRNTCVVIGITLSSVMMTAHAAEPDSLEDLGYFLGTWETTELLFPGADNEYVESSTRVCKRALQDTHIQCTTTAAARGKQREYVLYLTWREQQSLFEMVGLFSNWPGRVIYLGQGVEQGELAGIEWIHKGYQGEEQQFTTGDRMLFQKPGLFTWEVLRYDENLLRSEWPYIGIETAIKLGEDGYPQDCSPQVLSPDDGRSYYQFHGLSTEGRYLAMGWSQREEQGAVILDTFEGDTEEVSQLNNSFVFSPDGSKLLAGVYTDDKTEIVELDRKSGTVVTLASDPAWDWLPSYAPDGVSIVFNSRRAGQYDIYMIRDGDIQRLTETEESEANAHFSPDGKQVVFHRTVGTDNHDIVALNLETGEETVLIAGGTDDSYPAWSPRSADILFSSNRVSDTDSADLFIQNLDSGEIKSYQLTEGSETYGSWSPDGVFVYFNWNRGGVYSVARVPTLCFR